MLKCNRPCRWQGPAGIPAQMRWNATHGPVGWQALGGVPAERPGDMTPEGRTAKRWFQGFGSTVVGNV